MSEIFRPAKITDKVIDLANFNRMVDWIGRLANMTVDQHMFLSKDPVIQLGIRPGSGGGLSLDEYVCFGHDLDPDGDNPAEVVIYSGEVHHGTRTIIDVVDTKKVITVDQQYVWVEYVLGSGVATIAGPSTTRPVSSEADSTFREWLYLFALDGGTASLERVGHFGNIIIPGRFG